MIFTNLPIVGICLGIIFLLPWLISRIGYRLTTRALEITFFGFCLRRIPLDDIRYISKHRSERPENWANTLFPRKRILIIRRRHPKARDAVITPEHRYVFKAAVEQAMSDFRARKRTHSSQPEAEPLPPETEIDPEEAAQPGGLSPAK